MTSLKYIGVFGLVLSLFLAPVASVGVHAQTSTDTQTDTTSDYSSYPSDLATIHSNMEGDGSPSDPYVITNVYELQSINQDVTADYVLANNIDASGTQSWDPDDDGTAEGFNPIGTDSNRFSGILDGKGYEVDGLYIDRPSENNVGVFKYLGGLDPNIDEIQDIGFTNVDITGNNRVGGLVGNFATESNINNSYVSGSVTGTEYVGGVIGYNTSLSATISSSSSSVSVSGQRYIGGLVGYYGSGSIVDSYATGSVTGVDESGVSNAGNNVGGLVGSSGGDIDTSYATGSVTGVDNVGGLVGISDNSSISKSFATGNIDGARNVGGLVGYARNDVNVNNTYARGDVTGDENVGGLLGYTFNDTSSTNRIIRSYATGSISGSGSNYGGVIGNYGAGSEATSLYWDTETTGLNSAFGVNNGDTAEFVEGLTTSEMQGTSAESNMTNFDFTSVWMTVDGDYPELADNSELDDSTATPTETEVINGENPPDDGLSFVQIVIYLLILLILLAIILSVIYRKTEQYIDF